VYYIELRSGESLFPCLNLKNRLKSWSWMKSIVLCRIKKLLPDLAADQFRKRCIDFICGKRDTKIFRKLWNQLKDKAINGFCSDYWKSYSELIPSEKHCESKAETFTVGYNSRIRHYSAGFKRKTKCYSKSQYMMEISLKLLFFKLNNQVSIFYLTVPILLMP